MRYQYVSVGNLVQLTLVGDIDLEGWQTCFWDMKLLFRNGTYDTLLIDAEAVTDFKMSNQVCSEVMPGFIDFTTNAAMYSSSSLIFGLLRVVQGYSRNDALCVYRSREDAMDALRSHLTSPCIDQWLAE